MKRFVVFVLSMVCCVCANAGKPCGGTPFIAFGILYDAVVNRVLVDIFEAGEPRFLIGDVRVVVVVPDAAAGLVVDPVECGGG